MLAFYRDVLGLEMTDVDPGPGHTPGVNWAQLAGDGGTIELFDHADFGKSPRVPAAAEERGRRHVRGRRRGCGGRAAASGGRRRADDPPRRLGRGGPLLRSRGERAPGLPRELTRSRREPRSSSSGSSPPTRSTRRATRCSRRAPAGSATTSAAPGTRRGRGRSSAARAPSPAIGESGREEHVPELRVETVVPEGRIRDVVVALSSRIRTRSLPTTCIRSSTSEGEALHRRRLARQPRAGRVRVRPRGRGRDGARRAR